MHIEQDISFNLKLHNRLDFFKVEILKHLQSTAIDHRIVNVSPNHLSFWGVHENSVPYLLLHNRPPPSLIAQDSHSGSQCLGLMCKQAHLCSMAPLPGLILPEAEGIR